MLKLSIKSATNLPSPKEKPTKFKIKIYGINFINYYLGKTKYSSKVNSPVFNEDFLFDIFRIGHELRFIIYGKQVLKSPIFIGSASIDLLKLSPNITSGLLNIPISQQFSPLEAFLEMEYEFQSILYPSTPIQYPLMPVFYIYITYNPPLTDFSHLPVEMECFHPYQEQYYIFNSQTGYESFGYCSEPSKWINFPSGPTQVIRISTFNDFEPFFFIAKSITYNGVISFNFLACEMEIRIFKKAFPFFKPTKSDKISMYCQKSLNLTPGQSILIPIQMTRHFGGIFELKSSPQISQLPNELPIAFYDRIASTLEFNDFRKMACFSNVYQSILKLIDIDDDAHVPISNSIVITGGGQFDSSKSNYWKPSLFMFDKISGKRLFDLEKSVNIQWIYPNPQNTYNTYSLSLNLDEIGINTEIVFGVYCKHQLFGAIFPGYLVISDQKTNSVIIKSLFDVSIQDKCAMLIFRLYFEEDVWKFLSFRKYYNNENIMSADIDILRENNWESIDLEFQEIDDEFFLIDDQNGIDPTNEEEDNDDEEENNQDHNNQGHNNQESNDDENSDRIENRNIEA